MALSMKQNTGFTVLCAKLFNLKGTNNSIHKFNLWQTPNLLSKNKQQYLGK